MQLFSIGDIAKMFHLSVSSLRHYEKLGLIIPEKIDPDTGYRYYSVKQFEALNTVRYLRALDMPLSEISDFLCNRNIERIKDKLLIQKKIVLEKEAELKRIERKIENRLKTINDAENSEFDKVKIVEKPACRIVKIKDTLKIHDFLDMEEPIRRLEQVKPQSEAVIFLGKVGLGISEEHLKTRCLDSYDIIFLMLDEEDIYEEETETLPSSLCLSIRFHGEHSDSPEQYNKLLDYADLHKLSICGSSREITMIDYGITNDTGKFVTEISIPIKTK